MCGQTVTAADTDFGLACSDGFNGVVSAAASGFVDSVIAADTSATEVTVTATASTDLDDETYILIATRAANGQVTWSVSSGSSCLDVGFCSNN